MNGERCQKTPRGAALGARRCRRLLAWFSALALTCGAPRVASAFDEAASPEYALHPPTAKGYAALDTPAGIAEFGFGWLTLPGALVCAQKAEERCEKGDTSFQVDVWPLFRPGTRFAFGAGITLGLVPTTDAPRQDPPDIQREHTRGYLTTEGITRYYYYVGDGIESWLGVTGGLVVVSDSFASTRRFSDKALVGPRAVTVRTEGFSLGLATGASFAVAPGWSIITTLRYGNWFLPESPAVDALGDEASVAGRNTMFSIGLGVGYRTML